MKKIIFALAVSLVFASCCSNKNANSEETVVEQTTPTQEELDLAK